MVRKFRVALLAILKIFHIEDQLNKFAYSLPSLCTPIMRVGEARFGLCGRISVVLILSI